MMRLFPSLFDLLNIFLLSTTISIGLVTSLEQKMRLTSLLLNTLISEAKKSLMHFSHGLTKFKKAIS